MTRERGKEEEVEEREEKGEVRRRRRSMDVERATIRFAREWRQNQRVVLSFPGERDEEEEVSQEEKRSRG